MAITAVVNANYPNRIELHLGTITGPLVAGSTAFDPRQLLELYVAGLPVAIASFSFDVPNNRHLLFTSQPIDTTQVVQLIYHMPSTAYTGTGVTLPGFALVASVSTTIDTVTPSVGLAVPATNILNHAIPFTWNATAVAQIRITATSGYNSGLLSSVASAGVVYATGFSSTGNFTATIAAYDSTGTAIEVGGNPLTATISLTISAS